MLLLRALIALLILGGFFVAVAFLVGLGIHILIMAAKLGWKVLS